MQRKRLCVLLILFMMVSFTAAGCTSRADEEGLVQIAGAMEAGEDEEDDVDEEEDLDEEEEGYEDGEVKDESGIDDKKQVTAARNAGTGENRSYSGYTLEKYQLPGVFTLNKPKGWKVYKAGEYNTLAFLTRDEGEPLRQVFCFSEIGLFCVDENQKKLEDSYESNGGYPVTWSDMPLISPFDGTTFFRNFSGILKSTIAKNFLASGNMPKPAGFDKIEILSEEPAQSVYPGIPCVLVRALLVHDGRPAQGMFVASGVEDGFGHGTALVVAGITAPIREFSAAHDSLLKTIESFTLDPAYVQRGVQTIQENGERLQQISRTLSETSDIITKGWTQRNKPEDVRIQKQGDRMLGVERVYDADTGEVYEVKNGFYDYYKTHQSEYTLKNLEPLPDNDYRLWEQAPRLNHNLASP